MQSWEVAFSNKRTGSSSSTEENRTDYQRDFDRIIFSAAFRRLQNKTQIFPLPGNTFVHNRLTHSLEVASVGRSLGSMAGEQIARNWVSSNKSKEFYNYDLSNVIAAACLAHDIGNPSFGHSGESAISEYFKIHSQELIDGKKLRDHFNEKEWQDLISFEGNANAFRLLTQQFIGKPAGGFGLTYTTLASILKYPCESKATSKGVLHRKKYGFFQGEKKYFQNLKEEFNIQDDSSTEYESTLRHPFVYLVEAADDICYRIIDLEDAHRINIISYERIEYYYLKVIEQIAGGEKLMRAKERLAAINDKNEKVSYLRAKCIGFLVPACADLFVTKQKEMVTGYFDRSLMADIDRQCPIMDEIQNDSIKYIYNHASVIELEITGYKIMSELLEIFVKSVLSTRRSSLQKKTLLLIPEQFSYFNIEEASPYEKVMGVLDFISGMTDGYATSLYRKLMGIDIAHHS